MGHFDRGFHVGAYVLRPGRIKKVGTVHLVPCDFLARVAAELSHQRGLRAIDHVVAVIDRTAGSNRVEQRDVFEIVGAVFRFFARVLPVGLAGDPQVEEITAALRPDQQARILVVAVRNGPADRVNSHSAGHLVNDRMMVEDVSVDLAV